MANITNPIAVQFANAQIRPQCEQIRAAIAEITAMTTNWFAGINALFPNDSSLLQDGRDAEGVSRLTGADVNSVMGVLIAIAAASNSEIIAKPCVRPLDAE